MLTPRGGVQVDTISMTRGGNYQAHGGVAQALLQNDFNVAALRTNDILRKDEWILFDEAVIEVARSRLNGVGQLISRGLTYSVNNALGTTQLEWEQQGDMTPANISMSGVTEGERDRLEFTLQSMPLPIIHKDFELNIRHLEASRTRGQSIDTMQAQLASRIVSETVESLLYVGSSLAVLGGTIYGLTNHPDRNTGSVSGTTDWDTDTTGEEMVDDIIAMITALQADRMYGPYGLHVPYAAYNRMQDDFKDNSDKSIMQRLLEIDGLEFIIPAVDVPAASVVLHQISGDVVREVIGLEPTLVQWESMGGMKVNFKVMAIMVPQVRSTVTGQSGIAHYS